MKLRPAGVADWPVFYLHQYQWYGTVRSDVYFVRQIAVSVTLT